jgi:hypothetical protein
VPRAKKGEASSPGYQGELRREVGLAGAVLLGLGSMVGTGVFVSVGIAAGIAGPAIIAATLLAALIASLLDWRGTGDSTAAPPPIRMRDVVSFQFSVGTRSSWHLERRMDRRSTNSRRSVPTDSR